MHSSINMFFDSSETHPFTWRSCCSFFCFLCGVLSTFGCPFVLFWSSYVLSLYDFWLPPIYKK